MAALSRDMAQQAVTAIEQHGSAVAAAKAMGIARSTLRNRLTTAERVYGLKPASHDSPAPAAEKWEVTTADESQKIWSISSDVRTVEDALAKGEIDTTIWEVERARVNNWPTTVKDDEGNAQQVNNWQVRVDLKRKVPKITTDAMDLLEARLAKFAPKHKKHRKKRVADPHLLEFAIADHHFGKLCWVEETGNNYDLKIAEELFANAVEHFLDEAGTRNIERFMMPVGHDFCHVDNMRSETTKGTRQDADGRYPKIIEAGFLSLVKSIDRMARLAPVDLLLIQGNHDVHASYHLARELAAWYRRDERVNVDYRWRKRKYYSYGVTLLGLSHGEEKSKWNTLPSLMVVEARELLAKAKWLEWHTGHVHHVSEMKFMSTMEHEGIHVRTLPSLGGHDAWHSDKGYHSNRAAEAFMYHAEHGYAGHLSVNVDALTEGK